MLSRGADLGDKRDEVHRKKRAESASKEPGKGDQKGYQMCDEEFDE